MRSILVSTLALILLSAGATPAPAADVLRLELHQREDVVLAHQRFVGNIRAQAKREGIIVRVPQLYVYFTDQSAAWHLHGFRRGFERELGLTVEHQRRERSMVRIDRLLERTLTPDGEEYVADDLPEADLYILLYRRAGCDECLIVDSTVTNWLAEQRGLDAVWIDVWIDRYETD
jgi:hypothetical protein